MRNDSNVLQASLADRVLAYATEVSDRVALASERGAISYRDLARNVTALGLSLTALGVKRSDRVAILTTPREDASDARQLASDCPSVEHDFCLDQCAEEFVSISQLTDSGRAGSAVDLPERDENDTAIIAYASGSTGEPKGCMLPNKSMAYRAMIQYRQYRCKRLSQGLLPVATQSRWRHARGVVGVPDRLYSEVDYAFVLSEASSNVTEDVVRESCKEQLANFKVPKIIELVGEFPWLPNGKMDKTRLREIATEKHLSKNGDRHAGKDRHTD